MTPLAQMLTYNNPVLKLIQLLENKGKLTSEIIGNLMGMLIEESCLLLEQNNEEGYQEVKSVIHMMDQIELSK